MQLASILRRHPHLLRKLSTDQRSAANAILACRTEQYGHLLAQCGDCDVPQAYPHSCGHRSCPQCLNHCTTGWLERQSRKLLPCDYYMVTFTLPRELRPLARQHPKVVFDAIMSCAARTLKRFASNDLKCGDHIGLTAILHTHTRRLDYHPHVHVIMPNGGLSKNKTLWKTRHGNYLFNSRALAAVFRAKVLKALQTHGIDLPRTPTQWVAHCKKVGQGLPALQYLSRYLYRGVIAEKHILKCQDGQVTFRYRDNQQQYQIRTLSVHAFLSLVLQHVLPKGFRRVRDYGFLHGNAKQILKRVQWALQVNIPNIEQPQRPTWHCKHCGGAMQIVSVYYRRFASG